MALKDDGRTTDKSPMRRLCSVSLRAVLASAALLAALSAPAQAAWLPAAPIDAGAGAGPVVTAALAVAPDGRAIAAWVQRVDASPGSQARIWASAFSGGTWGAPTPLDVGTGDVSAPAAAIGGANGVVTFLQSDGTHRALWAARVVGGTIQATERIDAGTLASENVGGATVAVDDAGAITAVFSQYQGGRFRVLAARAVGGAWSTPAPVDAGAGSGNAEGAPQVATRSGVALAVWAQGTGTRARIYGARFDGTAWQPAAALDTGAGLGPGDSPQAGMTAADAGVVVWRQLEGAGSGRYRVYGARLTAGAWSAAALLDTPAAGALGDAATPALAVDATSGSAAAAWSQSAAGGRKRIYAARLVGDLWGAATALDAATGVGDSVSPSVALRTAGDGICAWYGYDLADSHYKVYASSLSGGTWSAPIVIGPATGIPLIGTTAAGDNLAVWYQNDGTRDRIVSAPEDHTPPTVDAGPDRAVQSNHATTFAPALVGDALSGVDHVTWDFGNGHTVARTAPYSVDYAYPQAAASAYTVTLTAWDRAGNSASDTALVTVGDVDPPVVDAGADVAVAPGTAAVLNGSAIDADSGIDPASIRWDLGDGATATTLGATHAYAAEGPTPPS